MKEMIKKKVHQCMYFVSRSHPRKPGKDGRAGYLSREDLIIHWTQDMSIISALPIIHDLEDAVGISNGNLGRDSPGAAIMHPDSRVVKMGQEKSRLSRAFLQGVLEKAREETVSLG